MLKPINYSITTPAPSVAERVYQKLRCGCFTSAVDDHDREILASYKHGDSFLVIYVDNSCLEYCCDTGYSFYDYHADCQNLDLYVIHAHDWMYS